MIYGIVQRPLTGAVASVVVLFTAYRYRHKYLDDSDNYCRRLVYTAIVSGMVGEALTYLVFSLPPGAPTSAPWVLLFVVAIGGAIGAGFGAAGLMLVGGLVSARMLPLITRDVFGRPDADERLHN